jgi:thiamine-monophosphate kinase
MVKLALSCGDDYELCFTVSPFKSKGLEEQLSKIGTKVTCIGQIDLTAELRIVQPDGNLLNLVDEGYKHF